MKTSIVLLGFTAVVAGQSIDSVAISSTPAPPSKIVPWGAGSDLVPYNSYSVSSATYNSFLTNLQSSSSSSKRSMKSRNQPGPCDALPLGYGPSPSPDTAAAFSNYSAFSGAANNAVTPDGYLNVFTNLNGASSTSSYIGYDTLQSYDVQGCASKCSSLSGCMAFNIYFERDPTQLPADACPNPASTTNIKCSYWGAPVGPETATNTGQFANDFQIVNAGSNGYNAQSINNVNVTGYTTDFIGNAAINAPTSCSSYITYKLFNDGQPFDPNRCAAACKAETDYNAQYRGGQAVCRFFNTYILSKNSVSQGQYCALYTASWDDSYATNTGYSSGSDTYTVSYSYTYSNTTDPRLDDCTCGIGSVCNTGNTTMSTTSSATTSTSAMYGQSTPTISSTILTITNTSLTTNMATTTTISLVTITTTSTSVTTMSTPTSSPPTTSTTSSTTKTSSSTSTTSSTTSYTITTKSTSVTTTTMTTSTKIATTSSASPTPKGPCFRMKIKGPSYCNNAYIGIDTTGALSYSASNPTTFWLDNSSLIRTRDGRFGRCPNAKTSAKNGAISFSQNADPAAAVTCSGNGNSVFCSVSGQSITSLWAGPGQGAVMLGTRPSGGQWDQISVQVEFCSCS